MFALLCLGWTPPAAAVEIKEVSSFAQKKLKDAPKRVFIEDFRVLYQLVYSDTEIAEGGREVGGGVRGDASASLTVAIQGVSEEDLKATTDALFEGYVARLREAGLELVTADAAAATEHYADWERKAGGELSTGQFPGYLLSRPSDLAYFVKRTSGDGKESRGFLDAGSHKLSADLGGAIVARVGLVVPFVVDAESGLSKGLTDTVGGVAKVVVKPDLRLEQDGVATGPSNAVTTSATYTYATRRIGPEAIANFALKEDLDIPGVMEEKKYKASESAQTDHWGTQLGAITVFHVADSVLERAQPVLVDPAAYRDGVRTACDDFLSASTGLLLGYVNR